MSKKHASRWILAATVAALTLTAADAQATLRRDPISFTRTSPSVVNSSLLPSHIVDIVASPAHGIDVGGVGPQVHLSYLDYGAFDSAGITTDGTPVDNVLDVSNNEVNGTNGLTLPTQIPVVYFSVSPDSIGIAGSDVRHQAIRNQQAADRFTAGVDRSPAAALLNGPAIGTANNRLSVNQTYYNAVPSINQFAFNAGPQDDADSLEVTEFKKSGEQYRSTPVYFNLDEQSSSLATVSASSPDILYTAVGTQDPVKFAAASTFGVSQAGDVVDGLAVYDLGTTGVLEPGTDLVLFSLRTGSPSLGSSGSGADIFVSDFDGTFSPYLTSDQLGLLASDEVDALDIDYRTGAPLAYGLIVTPVPEPAAMLTLGAAALVLRRRRA
jgi:hypothetical protein